MNHFPCILPAAGFGTRMAPCLSEAAPFKELLPVAGRPAILHALDQAMAAGASQVVVVLRPGKEALRDCLDEYAADLPGRGEILYRWQPEPAGEGQALLLCRELLEGADCFGVLYPDNVYLPPAQGEKDGQESALAILRQAACATGRWEDTLGLHRPDLLDTSDVAGYANAGRVDLAPHPACIPGLRLLTRFYDKGPGPFMPRRPGEARTCGAYVATPRFLDALEQARAGLAPGEELTDGHARRHMLAAGFPLQAFLLSGQMFDIGTPAGYELALRRVPSQPRP